MAVSPLTGDVCPYGQQWRHFLPLTSYHFLLIGQKGAKVAYSDATIENQILKNGKLCIAAQMAYATKIHIDGKTGIILKTGTEICEKDFDSACLFW